MTKYLIQLSDPHIKMPGAVAYGFVDTAAFLEQAVAAVNALRQPADAVVITGDLTDSGSAGEYAHLHDILMGLRCPVYLLPGNHDDRGALRGAFPDHAYLRCDRHFCQYAVDLGGMRLVALDTVVPMAPHGALDAERLADFDQLLGAAPNAATIVAMHHPPFATLIGHMDDIGLMRGAEELAAIVRRHPRIERVICGHLHRSIQARWAGTLAQCAPSTAHQVALDMAPDASAAFVMEPPGFLVHAWGEDGRIATHLVPIGDFGPPHPFDDVGG